MSGLLDSKQRIFDSLFTVEGRRQAATGKMKAEFYSFTDNGTFYHTSDTYASSSQDFLARMGLEVCSLPQDRITIEYDDSGKLVVREVTPLNSFLTVINGQVFSGSRFETKTLVTSSTEFQSTANSLLSSSIDNFNKLYLLASEEPFSDRYNDFQLAPTNFSFTITDQRPIASNDAQQASIDHIESLFADKRLSHIPNYQFLPPVNKDSSKPFGTFPRLGQQPLLEFEDLERELTIARRTGFSQTVRFTETSKQNRVVCQFFELADSQLTKLDVVDFGLFPTNNSTDNEEDLERGHSSTSAHVFFVGKLYLDSNNSHTFVNMFTLVFS